LGVYDAHAHSWERVADVPALRAHLTKSRRAKITRVHRDHRRAFRAAVAFQWTDAEAVLKRQRQSLRQFFCAHNYELQAAEIFRQAAAYVRLQKSGRGQ